MTSSLFLINTYGLNQRIFMMISWITNSGIIYETNEKSTLPTDLYVKFYATEEFNVSVLSSNLPESVFISDYVQIEENIYEIKISGDIPSVLTNTIYSFCIRLKQEEKILDSVFSIYVRNVEVTWSENIPVPPETIKFPVNTYNIYKLELVNSNGNEIIKKIDGVLPEGISIGNDGSIFGNITNESIIGQIYTFTVTVFIDNIAIARLNKNISIEVIAADPYDKPTWVTEAGYIGSVYTNKQSTLRIVATNSTSSQALFYKLEAGSNLPDGIELDTNGKLVGVPITTRTQTWEFTATAFKNVGSEKIYSDPRTFNLISNPVSEDDEIIWDDDAQIVDLGNCVIGQTFYGRIKAHTKSGLKITYKIIGNTEPKGIQLSTDGIFSGVPDYQNAGEYLFTVQAKTSINSSMKTVKMTLKKGLGKYAATLSFSIWIPQIDVYNELLGHLSKTNRYKQNDPNFEPKDLPLIDICTIRSYDKELLPLLLNFAYPEWIRFHKTTYKNVVTIDRYDDIVLDDYDIIYKTFDEAHYQWEELKNGSYDWEKHKPEGDSLTWNEAKYDGSKIELPADDAHPTPINKFNVMNIQNIRDRLTMKVYLERLEGTYWYFETDQRLAEVQNEDVSQITVERDGVQEVVYRIENPYVYKASLNSSLEYVSDFVLPHIDDIVEEENGQYYCQLLDMENEILPYWKRKNPVVWTTNTFYKVLTVILYEDKYYLATKDFTSTFNFNDNLDSVRKLTPTEVDYYLPAQYFPCLELGYYQAGKNDASIAEINSLESKGEFWTGKELVFDEVVVQPYYQNDMGTYTVTIVYPNIKNFPDNGVLEKE